MKKKIKETLGKVFETVVTWTVVILIFVFGGMLMVTLYQMSTNFSNLIW